MSRTRSAEELCTDKESDNVQEDFKGYMSDSTIDHSVIGAHSKPPNHKKKRFYPKEKYATAVYQQNTLKFSEAFRNRCGPSSGLTRMKSTGSLFKNPNDLPSTCETLLPENRHKRKTHRKSKTTALGKEETGHLLTGSRRRSIDSSNSSLKACGLLGKEEASHMLTGSIRRSIDSGHSSLKIHGLSSSSSSRPLPLHAKRSRIKHDSMHSGKLHGKLSYSFKGEKDRSVITKRTLSRSHSFSSVDDFADSPKSTERMNPSVSQSSIGEKWVVYGYV